MGAEASVSFPIPPSNETGTGPVTKTEFYFEANRPDAMTMSPPWVNANESTSPSTPSSALLRSLFPKSIDAKAAALLLSGGNFCRSVFVTR